MRPLESAMTVVGYGMVLCLVLGVLYTLYHYVRMKLDLERDQEPRDWMDTASCAAHPQYLIKDCPHEHAWTEH